MKKMNLIYAGLLLHSAGKDINEENVKKVAHATGENVEEAQIKALVAALDGIDIKEAISKAAMPVATVAAAAPIAGEAKKEEKAEESAEDKEKKAEEAAAGLGSIFG